MIVFVVSPNSSLHALGYAMQRSSALLKKYALSDNRESVGPQVMISFRLGSFYSF